MLQFRNFIQLHFDKNTPEYEYFNGFTTVNMCNPINREDIQNIRKKWIIENYNDFQSNNVNEYEHFYENNVVDNYSHKFNPPESYYTEPIINKKETDDIDDHYDNISKKYSRIVELNKNKNEYDIVDMEEDYDGYNTEDSISSYITLDDESYYDEEYDEYDDYIEFDEDYDY